MKRFTAVVTAAASAGIATAAIGIGVVPAFAATSPVTHPAAAPVPATAPSAAPPAATTAPAGTTPTATTRNVSQFGSGQYVSVVSCSGQAAPPPVHLNGVSTPLQVTGTTPSYSVTKAMATPGRYKPVYTCAVVVEKQIPVAGKGGGLKRCELATGSGAGKGGMSGCHKPVTLNTGFGGRSGAVSGHHPRTR